MRERMCVTKTKGGEGRSEKQNQKEGIRRERMEEKTRGGGKDIEEGERTRSSVKFICIFLHVNLDCTEVKENHPWRA